MEPMYVHVEVVPASDADDDELAELTNDLGEQLRELDADVQRPAADRPAAQGTKGVDIGQLGQLALALAQAPVLVAVLECVKRWVRRPGASSVRIRVGDDEIEMTGDPSEQQRELITAFIDRHGG